MIELLTKLEKWEKLINVYNLTINLSKNQEEIESLSMKIAQIQENKFSDHLKALFHYKHIYLL